MLSCGLRYVELKCELCKKQLILNVEPYKTMQLKRCYFQS